MEATASQTMTSNQSLFGATLDDLIAFRAAATAGQPETCGGCGREFPTFGDVFSHDCDHSALPRTLTDPLMGAYQVTAGGTRTTTSEPVRRSGDAGQLTPVMGAAATAEPTPPAEVEAWLLGLGRKVEAVDVTDSLRRAAAIWARDYTGSFEFMVEMRAKAATGRFSAMQAKATLNCWRADLLRAADRPATPAAAPAGDVAAIPEGRYAYTTEAGHTGFAKVEHGEGAWAGHVFVRLLVGAPGAFRTERTSRAASAAILAKIAADGPEAASVRFGHEVGQCGRCGSPLTNEESRRAGIGPDCAKKGW